MSDRIPDFEIRQLIIRTIGTYGCIDEARQAGLYVTPGRDRAIELALPLGTKLAQARYSRLAEGTRLTFNDLEQAAHIGVIRGIDIYEPARGVLVSTVCTTWINNEMGTEFEKNHWRSVKPTKAMIRAYCGRGMDPAQRRQYELQFCNLGGDLDEELESQIVGFVGTGQLA